MNGEFAKYNKIEELPSVLLNLIEQKTQKSLNKTKAGVGSGTITKFLNGGEKKGNWNQSMIAEALRMIAD